MDDLLPRIDWTLVCSIASMGWTILSQTVAGTGLAYLGGRHVLWPAARNLGRAAATLCRIAAQLCSRPPGAMAQQVLDLLAARNWPSWEATDQDGTPVLVRLSDAVRKEVCVSFSGDRVAAVTVGLCPILPLLRRSERRAVTAAALACLRGVTLRTLAAGGGNRA